MSASRFVLAEGGRERVDKALTRLAPGTSRATIQRWIESGRVLVDGRVCRAKDLVGPGSIIDVEPAPPEPSAATPDPNVRFSVLFEDDALLVIEKPAGLVVHPARGHRGGTLVNGLLARPSFGSIGADPEDASGLARPGIVHRIDKDTSGILVVAKTESAREALKAQLAAHHMERVYRALSVGVPKQSSIETLYGRDPKSRLRFTSRVNEGKRAVTHVRVVEVLAGGRAAFIECRLETGRTHQIRVHLLERAKTPLLGDRLYRLPGIAPELAPIGAALGRQALHAAVLGFVHPTSGEPLRFESALPDDFIDALGALRALS